MNNKICIIIGLTLILVLNTSCRFTDVEVPQDNGETQKEAVIDKEAITPKEEIKKRIEEAKIKPALSAEFELETKQVDKFTTIATIFVLNPEQVAIQSVQSWLTYNPENIMAAKIDTSNSAFNVAAPDENTIEPLFGLIKIGRSQSEDAITETKIEVAKVVFTKNKEQKDMDAFIDFYDYQEEGGHSQIHILEDGTVFNIAKPPVSPATIIH